MPRNNTRLSLRVRTYDWGLWHGYSRLFEKPVSALIRDAVEKWLADPPLYADPYEDMPISEWSGVVKDLTGQDYRASLRETHMRHKVFVLRLPTEVLRRWKIAAQCYKWPVSALIRRAVRCHVHRYEDSIKDFVRLEFSDDEQDAIKALWMWMLHENCRLPLAAAWALVQFIQPLQGQGCGRTAGR